MFLIISALSVHVIILSVITVPIVGYLKMLYQLQLIFKGKSVPFQAWRGSEGSRKLRFPDFVTTAQDGGKVVSLTHRPLLPTGNTPGTHFS